MITYTIWMICRELCHGLHLYAILCICYFHLLLSLRHLSHLLRAKVSPKNQSQASHSGEGEPVRTTQTCLNLLEKSHLGPRRSWVFWLVFVWHVDRIFLANKFWTWRVEKNNSQRTRSQTVGVASTIRHEFPTVTTDAWFLCWSPYNISENIWLYSNSSHQGSQNCDKRCCYLVASLCCPAWCYRIKNHYTENLQKYTIFSLIILIRELSHDISCYLQPTTQRYARPCLVLLVPVALVAQKWRPRCHGGGFLLVRSVYFNPS